MIKIKCFGAAKEIVNKDLLEMNQSGLSVKKLRTLLYDTYPEFSKINGFMIAVNQEYATDEIIVSSNDEVAIIPPVSGG